jgi:hypothetical protein
MVIKFQFKRIHFKDVLETKHAAPSSKSKDWNQDNVFEWRDMSSRGLLFR